MARLRTILNEYEIEKACENLHSYFRDIHERREDPKELLTLFPHLINKLFIDTNETVYVFHDNLKIQIIYFFC